MDKLSILILHQQQNAQILLLINNMMIDQWNEEDEELFNYVYLFFNSSPNTSIWEENWITKFIDYDFFRQTRISKNSFNKLLSEINNPEVGGPNLCKTYVGGGEPVSPERQLLITLSWLGQGHTLLSVADKFKVSPSTVFNCCDIILEKILFLKNKYIVWPNSEEMVHIESEFRGICGYPGKCLRKVGIHIEKLFRDFNYLLITQPITLKRVLIRKPDIID